MVTIVKQLVLAAAFMVATVAGTAMLPTNTVAAAAASNIGVVDYQVLVSQHPDMAAMQDSMKEAIKQAKTDFDAKAAGMNDQEKQAYYQQLQQGLQVKERDLLKAITDKVDAAIKKVADDKKLAIVVDKSVALYGGEDITVEVGKKLSGK